MAGDLKSRVPDTCQLGAILAYTAFLAGRVFYKLRVFNSREYSDSPRLHFVEPRNDRGVEPLLRGVAVFFLLNPLDVFWVVDNDNAGAVLTLFQSAYLLASEDRSGSVRSIPQRWNTSEIFAAVSGSRGAAR